MPMLEETGSIGLGPTGVFRIDDSRKFIGALLKFGQKGCTLWSHKLWGAITMRPREQMRASALAADITGYTWYTPRRRRYNVCGGALRIPKHSKMLLCGPSAATRSVAAPTFGTPSGRISCGQWVRCPRRERSAERAGESAACMPCVEGSKHG